MIDVLDGSAFSVDEMPFPATIEGGEEDWVSLRAIPLVGLGVIDGIATSDVVSLLLISASAVFDVLRTIGNASIGEVLVANVVGGSEVVLLAGGMTRSEVVDCEVVCSGTTEGGGGITGGVTTAGGVCVGVASVVEVCIGATGATGAGLDVISGAIISGVLDCMTCVGGDDVVIFGSSTTEACVVLTAVAVTEFSPAPPPPPAVAFGASALRTAVHLFPLIVVID